MKRLLLALLLLSPAAHAANPDVLWKFVSTQCVPDWTQRHELRPPCIAVDPAAHYVWFKDINGPAQILTMPTEKVTGMEDPAILAPDAPNWFAPAWRAATEVGKRLGHPIARENISLAINSVSGRTQNQLHIHTDCVNVALRAELRAMEPAIGPAWAPLPKPLAGHSYRALRLNVENLDSTNPIRLLNPADDIAHHTLAAIGTQGGIILLDDHAKGLDRGSAEELQDHTCQGS
jgi:CDP-diacylglycerol pyrophosphatase